MDKTHFDSLTRRLATTTTRRTGAVAIALSAIRIFTSRHAAAMPIATCRKTRQQCATNDECCSGLCRIQADPQRSRCARPNRKRRNTKPNDDPKATCLELGDLCENEYAVSQGTCCEHMNCEPLNPCSPSDRVPCDRSVHPAGLLKYCCAQLGQPCTGVGDCCNQLWCDGGTCVEL